MSGTVILVIFVVTVALLYWLGHRQEAEPAAPPSLDEPSPDPEDVGVIAIEDAIDLHGFQPREIPDVVESYLEAALAEGHREVRLIHGRGKGVQRQRVRALLRRHPRVLDFGDAPAHRGGWGATIVRLDVTDQEVEAPGADEEPPANGQPQST
jgi:dsDNA-specific endonuclease/ATPase MutS2